MMKITTEHLSRSAIVYVRQSTFYQVMNNLESGRRQYGLVDRARQLGWDDVQVIDEDLGHSGIYDPRLPNDRLLLGMKGTMSERWRFLSFGSARPKQ
jgi:DNA invertase Pin-like site-specific DNA recombinase